MTSPSTIMGSTSCRIPTSVRVHVGEAVPHVRPSRTRLQSKFRFSSEVTHLARSFTLLRWLRPSTVCNCTCASSFACAPRLSRFVQASVLHSATRNARSTPSLRSILPSVYEDGFSSHQYPLGLPLSTVGCCRHRSSVGGDYAPMGSCHSHRLASPHLVSGVLSDHVGVNEIVFEQARRKSKLSSKKLADWVKIQHFPHVD